SLPIMTLLKSLDTIMDKAHQVSTQLCQEINCEEDVLYLRHFFVNSSTHFFN
ncbi:hypothetical protein STEG23_008215, partial [Scotinomys teguina]